MLRHASYIVIGCLLAGIGLAGGWFAALQTGGPHAADEKDDAHAPHEEMLDQRTLANLGVTVAPARRSTFVRWRPVQAVVEDRPRNARPVVAPFPGIVTRVEVETGDVAAPGDALVVIARNPIPRPKPALTADVLTPVSEEVHEAVAALRKALGKLEIVDANLERVRGIAGKREPGGVRILRKSEIEFENERRAILVDIKGARHELERHGLSEPQIAAIEKGGEAPGNTSLWEHALRRSGLWPKQCDAIRTALPENQRDLPWVTAAIGELAASGLATEALATMLVESPSMRSRFAEVAGLLLEGMPLPTIGLLAETGALEPSITRRAPGGPEQWDVEAVDVRIGSRVETGDVLVRLHDATTMWLRIEPVGEEIGRVARALRAGVPLDASPLVPDSGPELKGLKLRRMVTSGGAETRGGQTYARVANSRLCPATESGSCTWDLRVGLRYLVKVPLERYENKYVLPTGAVTTRGPDRIVYIRDGTTFRAQPVRVEYEDDAVTVVTDDGGIFEDDPLVMSGAFALGLALQRDAGGNEHGHSH